MPIYRIEFTTTGIIDVSAADEGIAVEKAFDELLCTTSKHFMEILKENVEVVLVECVESDSFHDEVKSELYRDYA